MVVVDPPASVEAEGLVAAVTVIHPHCIAINKARPQKFHICSTYTTLSVLAKWKLRLVLTVDVHFCGFDAQRADLLLSG